MLQPTKIVERIKKRIVTLKIIATDRASVKIDSYLNSGIIHDLVQKYMYEDFDNFMESFETFKSLHNTGYKDIQEINFKVFEIIFEEIREAQHQNLHSMFYNCLEKTIEEYNAVKSAINVLDKKFDKFDEEVSISLQAKLGQFSDLKEDMEILNRNMKSVEVHTQAVLGCAMTGQFKKPVIADDGK